MSEDKRTPPEDEDLLEDILKEVSSWNADGNDTQTAPPPGDAVEGDEIEADQGKETPPDVSSQQATDRPADPLPRVIPFSPPRRDTGEEEDEVLSDAPPPDNLIPFLAPTEDHPDPPPPDNLIHFVRPVDEESEPPPNPETLTEVAQLGATKAKTWVDAQKESLQAKARKSKDSKKKAPPPPKASRQKPKFPDTPLPELAARYGVLLPPLRRSLRLTVLGFFLCLLPPLILAFPQIPIPDALRAPQALGLLALVLFAFTAVVAYPVLVVGFGGLLPWKPNLHTLASLATLAVLADGLLLLSGKGRSFGLPFYAPVALVLLFHLWGLFQKNAQLRQCCRTAQAAAAPDLMTAEPSQWNGKGVYRRRFGAITGFGAQIQAPDGAERFFLRLSFLLLPAAVLGGVLPAVIQKTPLLIPWALSATLAGTAGLSASLCFCLPFRNLSKRLSKLGVALAGWPGIQQAKAGFGLLVEDTDLFPPGAVSLTSHRSFGTHNPAYVISVTASLIRATGGGLDPLFHSLLRLEGGSYVTATQVDLESEGISAHVAGDQVLVGNLSYLAAKGIDIPVGVRVPMGVFCAIGGSFAGQFVLDYKLHKHAARAMDALLQSHVTPILIGLDFNLVPTTLRKLFRFPWDKMAFPELSQRAKLRRAPGPRESALVCLLCLQGLPPVSTAVVGAGRLHRAVGLSAGFATVGAVAGLALTAYLTASAAFVALTPWTLCLFLLAWFLPTALIAGWVNQF